MRLGTDQSGQVIPLVALLLGVAVGTTLLIANLGLRVNEQARSQAAADAAALAGALDGAAAARGLASANGGELEEVRVADGRASVRVRVGDRSAVAAAELLTRPGLEGLAPELARAVIEAERVLGEPLPIVSGYRSRAGQQALWDLRSTNPYPVARPGTSAHEQGLAIDITGEFVQRLANVSSRVGLCQPLPTTDPVHFEVCRTTATR